MKATKKTSENALQKLADYRQSPWLDYIRRDLLTGGELQRLIDEEGLKGMTSNPAIFEKAFSAGDDYKDFIKENAATAKNATALYERIAIRDIQNAADLLHPVYLATDRRDGYVSLEVSPSLAAETEKTIEEAHRLWLLVNRPNLMVKVPATAEGIPAIERLIGEGININVTFLFSQKSYRRVAEAYISGLEKRSANGEAIENVASVASFFVSRIGSLVDERIEEKLKTAETEKQKETLKSLSGKTAIANAKLAYKIYEEIFSGSHWKKLAEKGARTQRILWASTGTKNEKYSDVLYIEELIGKDTVNTIPPKTWDAFREHGKLRKSLTEDVAGAKKTLEDLEKAGISLDEATDKLLIDAVKLFVEPFDKMIAAVEKAIGENRK